MIEYEDKDGPKMGEWTYPAGMNPEKRRRFDLTKPEKFVPAPALRRWDDLTDNEMEMLHDECPRY